VPESEVREELRTDGALLNVLTGMGMATRDKTLATSVRAQYLLPRPDLENLYMSGIPRRYVDSIADEMLRHLVTISLGTNEDPETAKIIPAFEEYLKVSQFHRRLIEVIKLQRLYGGAGMVMLVDDGLDASEPVDPKRIRAVRDFIPFSRWELIPYNITAVDYSKPDIYRLTTSQRINEQQSASIVSIDIHHTRVARFDGLYLPWQQRINNQGWGQSVLQLIWESYKRYESAVSGLETLTSDADLFVHKMPGLFQRIAAGNESDLRKRMEVNNLSRSVYGGMALDKEEEVQFISRNLTGVATALEPFIKDLQAVTGWPASILMGDSPGGLGKEGRLEERVWSSLVEQWQEVYCRDPITQIFSYILASREGPTRGKLPESWKVHFPSVYTETALDKAQLRSQMATVDTAYVNLGVLTPLEVRTSRFGGTDYSIETTLNEDTTTQLEANQEQQFATQQAQGEAQMQALQQQQMQGGDFGPGAQGIGAEGSPEDGNAENASPDAGFTEGGPTPAEILGENQPAPESAPPRRRRDSAPSFARAGGLRIEVVTELPGGVAHGYPVAPDGQRTDAPEPVTTWGVVMGPARRPNTHLHRAQIAVNDSIQDGPVVTGFTTTRQALRAVRQFLPTQNVVGLKELSLPEVDALCNAWEAYP